MEARILEGWMKSTLQEVELPLKLREMLEEPV
jgi:hypothetical protein